jgi:hypothetical protein
MSILDVILVGVTFLMFIWGCFLSWFDPKKLQQNALNSTPDWRWLAPTRAFVSSIYYIWFVRIVTSITIVVVIISVINGSIYNR